jgi:hypothetical protein
MVTLDLTSGSGFATDSQLDVSMIMNMEFFIYVPPETWNYLPNKSVCDLGWRPY